MKKVFVMLLVLALILVGVGLFFFFSLKSSSGISLGSKKFILKNNLPQVMEVASYQIDSDNAFKMLKQLGFPQNNLSVQKLDSAPKDVGIQYKDDKGNTLFSSSIDSSDRDTIVWLIYVSPDYLKIKLPAKSDTESRLLKEKAATNIAVSSFISYSQKSNEVPSVVFPLDKRPVLIKFL